MTLELCQRIKINETNEEYISFDNSLRKEAQQTVMQHRYIRGKDNKIEEQYDLKQKYEIKKRKKKSGESSNFEIQQYVREQRILLLINSAF